MRPSPRSLLGRSCLRTSPMPCARRRPSSTPTMGRAPLSARDSDVPWRTVWPCSSARPLHPFASGSGSSRTSGRWPKPRTLDFEKLGLRISSWKLTYSELGKKQTLPDLPILNSRKQELRVVARSALALVFWRFGAPLLPGRVLHDGGDRHACAQLLEGDGIPQPREVEI